MADSCQVYRATENKGQARDSCSVYAELLAMKLREFDEFSRATVMNDIDNLMYRAKMRFYRQSDPLGNFSGSMNNANIAQNVPNSSCEASSATSSEFIEEYTERKVF